jgi:hypothetical protein
MIVELCTPERLENWLRMRKALWPSETLEEHRLQATSLLDRPNDAIAYVIAFAEGTLRRDMLTVAAVRQLAFSKDFMFIQHFVDVGSNARRLGETDGLQRICFGCRVDKQGWSASA